MVAAGYFGVEWSRNRFVRHLGATKCDSEGGATKKAVSELVPGTRSLVAWQLPRSSLF